MEPASGFLNDTLSVLPIVGIGGAGKTTLAQYAHKDSRVQDHFHLKIWICVSDNFTMQGLAKSIIESVTLQKQDDNMRLEPLQKILHQHIAKKKFLLVLDDVWSNNKSIWEKFCALLKVGAHGSKIIVTTRDLKVSKMVSLAEPISLHGLDEDVFWQLFKKCSFGALNLEGYPELEDIGRKKALKLKGSPLAAKTLGSVLQSNLCKQHWATIMESDIWKVKQDENDIMPALHLSYQYLNENLKQCFTFCSLFPKDYRFYEDKLIRMWMAEGFINEDKSTKRMEDVGSDYVLEFLTRSFFQEFEYDGFVMHDLIHDLSERISELSEHIGKLIHLRYLDLSYNSEIKILPESLCDLYNLQTLKAVGCSELESTPQQLSKLVNLRHIFADEKFWVMIKDIRRLTNLQELPTFRVQEEDGLKLVQLKNLTQLRGTLHIQNLENGVDSKEAQTAQYAELKKKVHVQELVLTWNDEKDAKLEEEVIEGLQPHDLLKILKIEGYNGGRSPSWLMPKVLSNLEKLELVNCKGWDDVLPFIGQRLYLIELIMYSMPALKQLSHEFKGKCFPKLEMLDLYELPALEEWSWTEGKDLFPRMRQLRVWKCPKLNRLPPFPHSLEILTIYDCSKLILNSKTEDGEECGCYLPPSLKVLELDNCGEYSKLLPGCLHSLRLVTRLAIRYCPHITSIPPVQLVELQYLYISNCDELRRMDCLALLKSLKELKIVGCPKLVQLDVEDEQAGSLSSLCKLCVDNTALLKIFPLRNSLSFITELRIESCSEEVIFEEAILMQSLTAVTSLTFCNCDKLQSLPTELVRSLTAVTSLNFIDCKKLQSLPTELLQSLPLLKQLNIYWCPQFQSLPEEELPPLLNHQNAVVFLPSLLYSNAIVAAPRNILLL
ncbi:disease resistance protein RGA2-like [Zingiber officinale]|uniref:disease resistance protein RGA2-like n=1 Tax=Zingiber officinale TaxID=94328 RepID=UPI001C4BBF17|nr:disease resistance protein RGA2-like [Zingiber officinale]